MGNLLLTFFKSKESVKCYCQMKIENVNLSPQFLIMKGQTKYYCQDIDFRIILPIGQKLHFQIEI